MPDENFECKKCGKEFDSERGLHIHQSQVHEEEKETTETNTDREEKMDVKEESSSISLGIRSALISVFILGIFVGFSSGTIFTQLNGGTSLLDDANNENTQETAQQNPEIDLEGIDFENEPSLGSSDAEIKVIEYSDYGCPWCAEWAGFNAIPQRAIDQDNNFDQVKENYVNTDQIEFIYKDYPAHPNSLEAHKAANCALEQSEDTYWDFHDQVYEQRDQWMESGENNPEETFNQIAGQVGLNQTEFSQCYTASNGSEAREDAQNIRNIQRIGTPTFFIGNREIGFTKISGAQPYQRISQIIESKLDQ